MSNKINWLATILTILLSMVFGIIAFQLGSGLINDLFENVANLSGMAVISLALMLTWMLGTFVTSKVVKGADYRTVSYWITALVAVPTAAAMVYMIPVTLYAVPIDLVQYAALSVALPSLGYIAGVFLAGHLIMKRRPEIGEAPDWRPYFKKVAVVALVAVVITYGYRAIELQDNRAGFQELTAKAEAGDAEAQYLLGAAYYAGIQMNGRGVPYDSAKAIEWMEKAAAQGNMAAVYAMADRYSSEYLDAGLVDYPKALALYRQAAEANWGFAAFELGKLIEEGKGTDVNFEEAAKWYLVAANENKDRQAMRRLISMYREGRGVEKDLLEAGFWAWVLADHDPLNELRFELTEEEFEESQRRAAEWWEAQKEEVAVEPDPETEPDPEPEPEPEPESSDDG